MMKGRVSPAFRSGGNAAAQAAFRRNVSLSIELWLPDAQKHPIASYSE